MVGTVGPLLNRSIGQPIEAATILKAGALRERSKHVDSTATATMQALERGPVRFIVSGCRIHLPPVLGPLTWNLRQGSVGRSVPHCLEDMGNSLQLC